MWDVLLYRVLKENESQILFVVRILVEWFIYDSKYGMSQPGILLLYLEWFIYDSKYGMSQPGILLLYLRVPT